MTTNTITCGILLSAGDIIQQKIEKAMRVDKQIDHHKHDYTRTGTNLIIFEIFI